MACDKVIKFEMRHISLLRQVYVKVYGGMLILSL